MDNVTPSTQTNTFACMPSRDYVQDATQCTIFIEVGEPKIAVVGFEIIWPVERLIRTISTKKEIEIQLVCTERSPKHRAAHQTIKCPTPRAFRKLIPQRRMPQISSTSNNTYFFSYRNSAIHR